MRGYIDFDKIIRNKGIEVANFSTKFLDEIVRAQPDTAYIDGRFRTPFNLSDVDPSNDFVLPLTINVYRKSSDFNLDQLCLEIASEYEQRDREFEQVSLDRQTSFFVYLAFRNSPLLRSKSFFILVVSTF